MSGEPVPTFNPVLPVLLVTAISRSAGVAPAAAARRGPGCDCCSVGQPLLRMMRSARGSASVERGDGRRLYFDQLIGILMGDGIQWAYLFRPVILLTIWASRSATRRVM